jgi:Transglutaminase elicitor
MKKNFFFVTTALCSMTLLSCGENTSRTEADTQEKWSASNDPIKISEGYETDFEKLPKQASLGEKPWTDTYWPTDKGGISHRWQVSKKKTDYKPNTLDSLKNLNPEEIKKLSPSEKYDIFMADYTYPLTSVEIKRTTGKFESWEGLCHGWAPAAFLYKEPLPQTKVNKDGIEVSFGSSDIKALLSLYQAEYAKLPTKFLGNRCNDNFEEKPFSRLKKACRDTNAGAFHLVLANQIGLLQKSFVIDITRDLEVWNQPVSSYTSVVEKTQWPSFGSAPGTKKEIVVKTIVNYTSEIMPSMNAALGTQMHHEEKALYKYILELSEDNRILGGRWISGERPDFLWTKQDSGEEFKGYFFGLKELIQKN